MKIVIIGGGKVGSKLSEELSNESHDVTVIEQDIDVSNRINTNQDVACINGNAINRELNYIKEDLGLSMIINPEFVAANVISRILRFPSAIKVETFAKGKVEIMEFKIYENSNLPGMQMRDVVRTFGIKVLVCAVQRRDEVFIPDGTFIFEQGDKLSIAASHEDLEKFLKKVGGLKRKVKTVMIIGGGKIAYYLCKSLENINIKTKIIERDRKTCHFLAQNLPKVDIIHGDGTDNQILEEEGIHEVDAFVSLTGIDEENIIMSMYADSKGVSKVITKISQSTFKDMIDTFNLDTVISPKELTATRILQYVKAMNNSYGSQLNSLYRIVNDKVEVLEFSVSATGRVVNQPLRDLKFKKGMLIACIVRNGKIIIPGGDDKIMVGDNIIIVTSSLKITDIEDILERNV